VSSGTLSLRHRLNMPSGSLYHVVVRFEVFTAVTMKNGVFWVVTPCGFCKNRRFGERTVSFFCVPYVDRFPLFVFRTEAFGHHWWMVQRIRP
jgi:hypothetical protein